MTQTEITFWKEKYENNQIGWDLGEISTPLKTYIDHLTDKSISILIPGCGNGYEAEYLYLNGFKNVTVIDLISNPLKNLKTRLSDFPSNQLVQGDFFEHQGNYDLIIEQTLFCAINPSLRLKYAEKIAQLLTSKGKLIGLLFNREFETNPPFGGSKSEYINYFSQYFNIVKMDACYNSIEPRKGSELFIQISQKKSN
ncbi:MAG: methyltransferase domain-containing protein [Flavobacteriia bacterium]|nr:methyltransferase domain-containing protein [Flavobacteriia bacterium]